MLRCTTVCLTLAAMLLAARTASAHCQVPCGIYTDQLRFEAMLEDTTTIAKGMDQIKELTANEADPLAHNQLARWVVTKEDHATKIQRTVADYFLTQRIKADADNYTDQLKAAHAVMVAAMKCKQTVDPANAKALENAIFDLYRAYEGKEPNFHTHE